MKKLRDKKTGEIIDIYKGEITIHYDKGRKTIHFKRFEDLDEWEDYEEPKEYWYIDYDGGILCGESDNSSAEKMIISMGNHFETIKEAEQAVEKLKAWKQLKDNGFRFTGFEETDRGCLGDFTIYCYVKPDYTRPYDVKDDLDLLFGGKE